MGRAGARTLAPPPPQNKMKEAFKHQIKTRKNKHGSNNNSTIVKHIFMISFTSWKLRAPGSLFLFSYVCMRFLASSAESFLKHVLPEARFFDEMVGPSFLYTIAMFWLDFTGLGPPAGAKQPEKQLPNYPSFFWCGKRPTKPFCYLRTLFGVISRSILVDF